VIVGVAMMVGPSPASAASDLHRPCSAIDAGLWRVDPDTGALLVCTAADSGPRWEPQGQGTPIAPTPTTSVPGTRSGSVAAMALKTVGPVAGDPCPVVDAETLSGSTGARLRCQGTPPSAVWTLVPMGSNGPTVSSAWFLPRLVRDARRALDPLDPDLGDPTGLPPGVSLPAGTVQLAGSPWRLPPDDWWKHNRWEIQATVGSTDLEALNNWFGAQCQAIGWYYDPLRVERFPYQNPPNREYDTSVVMVAGECRTYAGSAGDPSRRRPWFLEWSVALRPGEARAELVVELRASTRLGGRPG
jgi:hypothetical protein